MPSLQDVHDFMCSHFINVTISKNGQHFHTRCPLCGDSKKSLSKKRFHLQYDSDESVYWKCWNCNTSGNFYVLYANIIGCSKEEAYKKFNKYDPTNIKNKLKAKKQKIINKKLEPKQNFNFILNDCISLDDQSDGFIMKKYQKLLKQFINSRKIDQKVYIAYKGDFIGRVIIPIWENDNIVYFQGRTLFNTIPKYLNPSAEKENIILNQENFDKDKYIITTEGLLDAFSVEKQGTCILGKELSTEFINIINKYTNKGIILALDNDIEGYKQILEYVEKYKKIKYFLMPKKFINVKDLNELLSKQYINSNNMYEFVVKNSYDAYECKTKVIVDRRIKSDIHKVW